MTGSLLAASRVEMRSKNNICCTDVITFKCRSALMSIKIEEIVIITLFFQHPKIFSQYLSLHAYLEHIVMLSTIVLYFKFQFPKLCLIVLPSNLLEYCVPLQ